MSNNRFMLGALLGVAVAGCSTGIVVPEGEDPAGPSAGAGGRRAATAGVAGAGTTPRAGAAGASSGTTQAGAAGSSPTQAGGAGAVPVTGGTAGTGARTGGAAGAAGVGVGGVGASGGAATGGSTSGGFGGTEASGGSMGVDLSTVHRKVCVGATALPCWGETDVNRCVDQMGVNANSSAEVRCDDEWTALLTCEGEHGAGSCTGDQWQVAPACVAAQETYGLCMSRSGCELTQSTDKQCNVQCIGFGADCVPGEFGWTCTCTNGTLFMPQNCADAVYAANLCRFSS